MLKEEDDLTWYARKADALRRDSGISERRENPEIRARVDGLLEELRAGGIRGSIEDRTMYTKRLPPGCVGCLAGEGTNLYVTGKCTRDCFFCFNTKPRTDEIVVHGIKINEPEEAAAIVERFGLTSVGISGGEPLLQPERVIRIIRSLRASGKALRIDLYTNGDLASEERLRELKSAGLDSLRFNLVAREFDAAPVLRSLAVFPETTVEIPVVPERMAELKSMVLELDRAGVPYLNIHELFSCRENDCRVDREGYAEKEGVESKTLQWKPVADGEAAALELLLFSLREAKTLSTYYCSCRTQELIGKRGLERRLKLESV
jgi:pyruvate formate-lyase activating enzyme-like uncharacterized protein